MILITIFKFIKIIVRVAMHTQWTSRIWLQFQLVVQSDNSSDFGKFRPTNHNFFQQFLNKLPIIGQIFMAVHSTNVITKNNNNNNMKMLGKQEKAMRIVVAGFWTHTARLCSLTLAAKIVYRSKQKKRSVQ